MGGNTLCHQLKVAIEGEYSVTETSIGWEINHGMEKYTTILYLSGRCENIELITGVQIKAHHQFTQVVSL